MALFRSWCYNAVATFSLCLLAQAYEQAYNLLQILFGPFPLPHLRVCTSTDKYSSAELEMTVNILIQIDKLVQLLESPVFTCKSCSEVSRGIPWLPSPLTAIDLRLQLLEPEKYPHLYKCLYGLLMLLPQSSAFAALKNRLNSVSSIGYLHIAPRPYVPSPPLPSPRPQQGSVVEATVKAFSQPSPRKAAPDTHTLLHSTSTTPGSSNFDRPNRLKGREDGIIRWNELLEKFRSVQERARRTQRIGAGLDDSPVLELADLRLSDGFEKGGPGPKEGARPTVPSKDLPTPAVPAVKLRSGLGRQFGRLGAVGRGKRNQQ